MKILANVLGFSEIKYEICNKIMKDGQSNESESLFKI